MSFTPENLRKIRRMSDVNTQLKQQQDAITGLQCQLDAAKQMFNESSNANLILRTQLNLGQRQLQELSQNAIKSQQTIDGLNQQLSDATAKIAALEPPKENSDAA